MKERYMKLALVEAKKAFEIGEVPVGAVIVKDDIVLAKSYNKKEKEQTATSHAEINAINKASKKISNWRLNDCEIYVTLEPCPMCASAIKQSRIKKIYYGVSILDSNTKKIVEEILSKNDNNSLVFQEGNVLKKECLDILQRFFEQKRKK